MKRNWLIVLGSLILLVGIISYFVLPSLNKSPIPISETRPTSHDPKPQSLPPLDPSSDEKSKAPKKVSKKKSTAKKIAKKTKIPSSATENNLDSLLQAMPLGNIAFNAPTSLNIERVAQIQLLLDLTQSITELQEEIAEDGEKHGATIRISHRMEAKLEGPMFTIAPITKEIQAVSQLEPTEWKWEVHPTKSGNHNLHLTLSALLQIEGQETFRMLKTFDKTIQVRVTTIQKVESFIMEHWKWLWAAVLMPVAGWIWRRISKTTKQAEG